MRITRRGALSIVVPFLFTPDRLHADSVDTLFDLVIQGGWPMAPIGICLTLTIYFAISGFIATGQREAIPREDFAELCLMLSRGEVSEVSRLMQEGDTMLARVMSPVVTRTGPNLGRLERERLEGIAQQALQTEQELIAQSINYLNVVSSLAPMLGLLGTVWGMIGAFQTISDGGMGSAQLMAGDISMGLITTAAGLIVAMPGVVAFWLLRNRLQRRCIAVARAANLMLDYLEGKPDDLDGEPEQSIASIGTMNS